MAELHTALLYEITVDLDKPIILSATPHGTRVIYPIVGGKFKGPKLAGEVLPNGADWGVIRADGQLELNVRALIRTDDDHLIYTYYQGVLAAAPEVWQRINTGQPVEPGEYYFRIAPFFETASEKYAWLNRIVAVGTGWLTPTGVAYTVYEVL